jgi:hypothetical protein
VKTGETPKKRAFNVVEGWERTKPRELLVESFRRRKAGQNDVETSPSEDSEQVLSQSSSTISTLPSDDTPPSSGAPEAPPYADQQILPSLGKSISKKGVARKPIREERPAVTILGEGMASNVPVRRSRKV